MDSTNFNVGSVKPKAFTWQQAFDLCRSHCKELLTLDSFDKAYLVSSIIKFGEIYPYVELYFVIESVLPVALQATKVVASV